MFGDDKSSSKYWNNKSIINWNKECFNGSAANIPKLVKLVIFSIVLVAFGFFVFTWLYPYSSPTIRHRNETLVNLSRKLSITNSSMTEEPTTANSVQKTSTLPPTNVISHGDGHAEKSNDDALLTKKYVRLRFIMSRFLNYNLNFD